ncbi:hypothetical protein [Oceanicella sp. SM1341]|uniref:GumC family protein n=1 Tax=Oceanicella sp. SM1341 TaxID=1548889 RepID=UPI000E4EDB16|nr:hypothetical protein [Oceanicella sp. SM1341]
MTARITPPRPQGQARLDLSAPPGLPPAPEPYDGHRLLGLVRARLGFILVMTALLSGLAVPLVLSTEPRYRASARVLIHGPLARELSLGTGTGTPGPDVGLEVERLRDRDTAVAMIGALGLETREEFNPALRVPSPPEALLDGLVARLPLRLRPAARGGEAPSPLDRVIANFDAALGLDRQGSTGVVSISFTSRDPGLAAASANALGEVYQRLRNDRWRARIDGARDWLATRIAAQRARVDAAAAALRDFEEGAGEAAPAGQEQELQALALRLSALREARAGLRTERAAAAAAATSGAVAPRGEPAEITALRGELEAQQRRLDTLARTYGENYAEVTGTRAAAAATRAALREALDARGELLARQDEALAAQEADTRTELAAARSRLARAGAASTVRDGLAAAVEAESVTLRQLEAQRATLDGEAALPAVEVEVLQPATVPLRPSGQSRKVLLAMAVLAAGVFSVTLAALREMHAARRRPQPSPEGAHGNGQPVPARS